MLFDKISPEQAGISSDEVKEFIDVLERHGANTHTLLLMKGDKLFAEYYWAPFNRDFLHREYSQTKSYVSMAIGLLEEDGLLSLDDKIVDLFPEKAEKGRGKYLPDLTVREMLMMETGGGPSYWFSSDFYDRTRQYMAEAGGARPSGTLWEYDSAGSQVLSNLVEKIAGMPLLEFLKKRIFNEIGTFQNAYILKARNEDSWGDSALLCTARDMISGGRFLLNKGQWNGKQLLNKEYIEKATSKLASNNETGFYQALTRGYGYQIWKTEMDGFGFIGMGDQLTICVPEKDLIFVINSDNQGDSAKRSFIIDSFFDRIARKISDNPLPENPTAFNLLEEYGNSRKLLSLTGQREENLISKVNNVQYVCESNPMGWTDFRFVFDGNDGILYYTNTQGKKELKFGIGHNVFGKFPQLGYSQGHGGSVTFDGSMYDDAVSLCFPDNHKIMVKVQIIDRYFGNATLIFGFKDNNAVLQFSKTAEDFLNEYQGFAVAEAKND